MGVIRYQFPLSQKFDWIEKKPCIWASASRQVGYLGMSRVALNFQTHHHHYKIQRLGNKIEQ